MRRRSVNESKDKFMVLVLVEKYFLCLELKSREWKVLPSNQSSM
jgi:hypothetical protein